jgi:hypothetical protein
MTKERAREECFAAVAALLRQGGAMHAAALIFLLVAVVAALRAATPQGFGLSFVACVVATAETWFAARVGLDASLFARLADQARDGRLDMDVFDEGLRLAGLATSPRPGREAAERVRGARGLFARQATATAGVALLALATLVDAGLRR